MWLINTTSLALEFIEDPETCIYAILSHTWGDGEVSFQDMADINRARKKQGFSKIERTCQLACDRTIEYAWVESPAEFKECSHLQNISDPGVLPAQVSITDQGFNITDRLSDGEQDYLLNLDCTINKPKETIVVRLVRTAHGYARHQFHRHASSGHHLLRKSAMSTLPIPKTISPAESKLIKLRLKHRFSFDLGIDLASFKYSLLRKPQHLWDSATKTLITDGYEAFTGIIEIKTFADAISIPGAPSGYTLDGSRFVIFGLKTIQVLNDSLEKTLSPWAGIYSTQGNGRPILSHIVSLEETHGFPHVARRAREFVLEQDSRKLPRISEEIAVSRDQLDFGRKRSRADRTVKFVLSMEVEETSDVSIYKMEVNVGWKDEVDGHESVQHRSVA
ncbi:hypothetical protein IFR05_003541 [Cadophora sp. M221]|nr:hypothetical protein IFR05_003541 [Cadophora sp. M221]